MYDENAQDEASITVIATGLDEHNSTSVTKAMAGFTNFKPKAPAAASAAQTERAAPRTLPLPLPQALQDRLSPPLTAALDSRVLETPLLPLLLPDLDRNRKLQLFRCSYRSGINCSQQQRKQYSSSGPESGAILPSDCK